MTTLPRIFSKVDHASIRCAECGRWNRSGNISGMDYGANGEQRCKQIPERRICEIHIMSSLSKIRAVIQTQEWRNAFDGSLNSMLGNRFIDHIRVHADFSRLLANGIHPASLVRCCCGPCRPSASAVPSYLFKGCFLPAA
jgi:hypothetical protein